MRSNAQLLRAYLVPEFTESLARDPKFRLKLWTNRFSGSEFNSLAQAIPLPSEFRANLFELNHELMELPLKSPWVAGGASFLLPGAGQVYVGSFQSAAISFVMNALFLATTLEFARKDLPAAALASRSGG